MKKLVLPFLCLFLVVSAAFAGEPITIGETIQIQSKIMDEERTILVSTPRGYEQSSERFPVLYMTDGPAHFLHTRGTVDFLSQNGLMPQVIIVAVTNTDRNRDLTPTNSAIIQGDGSKRELPTSGGASKFLDFFADELFGYIDSNYRTDPYRIFSGHSFGGLFALNATFTRPDLFQAVLAVSPNLLWDEEISLRQAQAFFADRSEFRATLFVAMGNEEEGYPRPNRLDRFEEILKKTQAEGFDWEVKRFPDENHGTVVLRAHYWGLRKVFENWVLPRDSATGLYLGGVDDLEAHYSELSTRFGYAVVPPEQQVNFIGYQTLRNDDASGAIEFFRLNVKLHPDSANVYDSLAEALAASGKAEDALANYTKAVETATRVGDKRIDLFKASLDRFVKARETAADE